MNSLGVRGSKPGIKELGWDWAILGPAAPDWGGNLCKSYLTSSRPDQRTQHVQIGETRSRITSLDNLQQMRTWKKGQRGAHSIDKVLGWKKETRLWSDWQNALSECICNSGGGGLTALNGRDYTDDSLDHSRERPGTRRLRQNGRQPKVFFYEMSCHKKAGIYYNW